MLIKTKNIILMGALIVSAQVSAQIIPPTTDFSRAEKGESAPGGATSSKKTGKRSFLQPAANLRFEDKLDFKIGESIFDKLWVFSPSSTQASDGLGPLHNARSCMGCHIRGGRGHTPKGNWPQDNAISMLMRLSITAQNSADQALLDSGRVAVIIEPTYGGQLQDFAMQGMAAEGRIHIEYQEKIISLEGGEQVSLRVPSYSVTDLQYGELHPDTQLSVRVANPMIGLGLLEAIDADDIYSLQDIEDSDGDGISGRANQVWDSVTQSTTIGRFGWKAGNPNLEQQNSAAFATDMGLSTQIFSDLYQGDCTAVQKECITAPDGRSKHLADLEVAPQMSQVLSTFVRNIAVPKRRMANDSKVLQGKALFYNSGCTGCHQPAFVTSTYGHSEQADQLIWPYTDMLLHDMGEGLADHRSEFKASGFEWRTTPLWGLSQTEKVSGKPEFLHDGRARSLTEAILWHGGEARASRDKFTQMAIEQRRLLIKFLESL